MNTNKTVVNSITGTVVLILCLFIVGFWEVMSNRAKFSYGVAGLTAADFEDFKFESDVWTVRRIPFTSSLEEPNILALEVTPINDSRLTINDQRNSIKIKNEEILLETNGQTRPAVAGFTPNTSSETQPACNPAAAGRSIAGRVSGLPAVVGFIPHPSPVLVRLAHGYNMPDCMRIKGYVVELLDDGRQTTDDRRQSKEVEGWMTPLHSGSSEGQAEDGRQTIGDRVQKLKADHQLSLTTQQLINLTTNLPRIQIWRLTSQTGDVSIWATSMIKADDFSGMDKDIRSMPFPRIGIPDDPNWMPQGISWQSLRHPIQNMRITLNHQWNNSRCDLATFLRLKQPAWVSEEVLTLVSRTDMKSVDPDEMKSALQRLCDAHLSIYLKLVECRLNFK